jgi:hypothetical protein
MWGRALLLLAGAVLSSNAAVAQQQSLRETCYQNGRLDVNGNSECWREIARQVFFSMGDWDSKTVIGPCRWERFRYCEQRLIDQEGLCWHWVDWGRPSFMCFVAPRDGYRSRYSYPSRPYSDSYPRDAARNGFERRYSDDGEARTDGRLFPYENHRPTPAQRPAPQP